MTVGDFVLQDGHTVVMAGDSITACGRGAPAELGDGYVRMIAALSAARRPGRHIRFVNAGVAGNTIADLAARWDRDVLAHRPNWLSVSIGVNDVRRQLDSSGGIPVDHFTAVYRELLERTRARCSGCGLILMTPAVIGEQPASEGNRLLQPYIDAIRQLAGHFNAFCIPIHQAFAEAIGAGAPPLTRDGVHPNDTGHALMALTWLKTLGW
ncbi:MAG: SGNH/GDSL hydrolase family protein [Planctomycetota bacterium]